MSPCEHKNIGGSDVIICSRGGPKKRLCEFCKREYATKQCDFPIERRKASSKDPRDAAQLLSGADVTFSLP